jgi:hypothetical protein
MTSRRNAMKVFGVSRASPSGLPGVGIEDLVRIYGAYQPYFFFYNETIMIEHGVHP